METSRKYVLITGCSAGGIGAGMAEAFLDNKYHVFVTLRNLAKVPTNLANSTHVTILQLDVLQQDSINAAAKAVATLSDGRLHVLVNNSGQNLVMPALDTSIVDARHLFDINFFAILAMTQAFAPLLIKARGFIVNQASAAGYMGMPFLSIYSSSKAAMIMASNVYGRELEPLGVRTLTLITTSVKTPAFENVQMPRIAESSYYSGIRDYIYGLGDGRLQQGGLDPLIYGQQVVEAVGNGKVGELWLGKDAGMSRWARALLPSSVMFSEGVARVGKGLKIAPKLALLNRGDWTDITNEAYEGVLVGSWVYK